MNPIYEPRTNTTAEAKTFILKDYWKARFALEGFEVKENKLMPDNCIAFVTKDLQDVVWFNIDNGEMYHLDGKKIMDDLMKPEIKLNYDDYYKL